MKLLFAILLLFCLSQAAGLAVELALWDICFELNETPMVHPKVTKLLNFHGQYFFTFNDELQEYGFYRGGKWCAAR